MAYYICRTENKIRQWANIKIYRGRARRVRVQEVKTDTRNEIKSYIVRQGFTMAELVEKLADQYGWSACVPNLSGKLRRDSLRYREAVELADALGYDIIWQRRGKERHI